VWTATVKRHGLAGFAAIQGDGLVQNPALDRLASDVLGPSSDIPLISRCKAAFRQGVHGAFLYVLKSVWQQTVCRRMVAYGIVREEVSSS
jgi:hypothetical protein